MAYKDIVNINITRQTTSVSVAAFNVPSNSLHFCRRKTTILERPAATRPRSPVPGLTIPSRLFR